MIHELKVDSSVFTAMWNGLKPYEIRFNDRNYQVGDQLALRETRFTGEEMKTGKPLEYTPYEITAEISYILHGPLYGIKEGWVILTLTDIQKSLK